MNVPSVPSRVLILKFWAIGDVLIATPMLAALRAANPDVHITWAIDKDYAEILRGHPDINTVWALDTKAWRELLRNGNLLGWWWVTRPLRRQARDGNFDTVINCHPEKWWSAAICVAPQRVGLYPSRGLPASHRRYTIPLCRSAPCQESHHYLNATRALGCPDAKLQLTVGKTPDEKVFLTGFRAQHGLASNEPYAVIAPFTTQITKNWTPEGYARIAAELPHRAPGLRVVLTLGPRDQEAADALARDIVAQGGEAPIVARGTGLREYTALLRHASVVVCGDTSALHIAAAVGTPYVGIFGSTDPARLAPLAGRGTILYERLPCSPCYNANCTNVVPLECMTGISPQQVINAVVAHLPPELLRMKRYELFIK